MNSGRAGRRAVAAAGTSPGPGLGIKAPSGTGRALGGRPLSSMGEGAGHPRPNPVEFFFYHQSIFVPLIFFLFLSEYRISPAEEGLEPTLAMSQYMGIDPGVPALL